MDEFGSEDQRLAEPPRLSTASAWSDWSRDEWAFRIMTAVAAIEGVILLIAGLSVSGVLAPSTGTIVVDSQPPSAEVRIDGIIAGTTPLSITAQEGRRTLEIRDRQLARTLTIDVVGGQTTHSVIEFVTPPPPTAATPPEIRITSQPSSAQVTIDGTVRGTTPLIATDLAIGTHAISVRGRNGQVDRSVDVAAGQPQTVHVLLPAPPPGPGWIDLVVSAPLRVFESGRFVGVSGAGPIALPPGVHDLDFVNEELGVRLRQRVTVQSDATATVTPNLPRGTLAINAQPWAEVWLNGERVGETPIGNLSRPVGQYDVVLRHPDLGERRVRVRLTGNETTRMNVDLRQRADGQ